MVQLPFGGDFGPGSGFGGFGGGFGGFGGDSGFGFMDGMPTSSTFPRLVTPIPNSEIRSLTPMKKAKSSEKVKIERPRHNLKDLLRATTPLV